MIVNYTNKLLTPMTDTLRERIFEKIERLPETTLVEVLDFVEFVEWRKFKNRETRVSESNQDVQLEEDIAWLDSDLSNLGSYEPYDWQPGELEAGLPIKYIPGQGVVIVEP